MLVHIIIFINKTTTLTHLRHYNAHQNVEFII